MTSESDLMGILTGSVPRPEKHEIGTGRTKFQVHWSVNITQATRLTSAQIDKLELTGTEWNDA